MVSLRGHSLTLEQLNAPPNAGFSIAKAEVLVMTGFSISVHLTASSPFAGAPARPCRRILCPLTWNWREREKKNGFSLCVAFAWNEGGGWKVFHWLGSNQTCEFKKGGCWVSACSRTGTKLGNSMEGLWGVFGVWIKICQHFDPT